MFIFCISVGFIKSVLYFLSDTILLKAGSYLDFLDDYYKLAYSPGCSWYTFPHIIACKYRLQFDTYCKHNSIKS